MINFDLPTDRSSIIKVIGIGGGGSNAVNHMYREGIKGVDFIVCNTDQQALDISPVPLKIALGSGLTEGRGAGSLAEVGRRATLESIEDIRKILGTNTKMVFITAGLGGGTGTGGAPVIAQAAKEMGILTVAIVTVPFAFEGKKRKLQAEEGLKELRQSVDTILIINNDKLREMYGNLKLGEAFAHADNILNIAAKSIAEIITVTLHVNLDFADVQTVMKESGVAIMGSACCEGEDRALKAVELALASPLLNDNDIRGARYVLLNITCGSDDITMDELGAITDYLQEAAGQTADIIKGYGIDETLGDKINVTLIATGFSANPVVNFVEKKAERIIRRLDEQSVEAPVVITPLSVEPVAEKPANQPQIITHRLVEEPVAEKIVEEKIEIEKPIVIELAPVEAKVETAPEPFLKPAEEKESIPPVEFEIVKKIVFELPATPVNNITEIPIQQVAPPSVQQTPPPPVQQAPPAPVQQAPPIVQQTPAAPIQHAHITPVQHVPAQPAQQPQQSEKIDLTDPAFIEEQRRKSQERIEKLKQLSYKLRTPAGITELENEPAYKRRNVELEDMQHSSESTVSRFTITEGEDKKTELKQNNSFLHDNVD